MFKFNHKYLIPLLFFFTFTRADDFVVEKESNGTYQVYFEKNYQLEDELELDIDDYEGDIIISGLYGNSMSIRESCLIKTYSEQDARSKYYQSKVGFILNKNRLEINGNRRSDKINSTLELIVPDFTSIRLDARSSAVSIREIDGKINLSARDCDIDLTNISSKVKINCKSSEIIILDCTMIGELYLSRGYLSINGLESEYFNATLFGASLDADGLDSRVIFKTTGGDIAIEESRNDAKLYASGGDIVVEKIYGNIACDTKGGSIEIEEVQGLCKIDCIAGDVMIDKAMNNLNINAVKSDIEVGKATRSVFIESSDADIELGKRVLEKDDKILIKNRSGDITLYLDEDINAEVVARIEYHDDFDGDIDSDFELDRMKTERSGRKGYVSRKGRLNEGGGTIILHNKNGDIYIYEN